MVQGDNPVLHRCLTSEITDLRKQLGLELPREHPWSLPKAALADGQQAIVRVLVLRFNFQYETTDDPNTTGRGVMDFTRPLANPSRFGGVLQSSRPLDRSATA